MRGILFMQKSLSKKIAVAVSTRRAVLKAKDTIDAYFCPRAFTVFFAFYLPRVLNLHFHGAGLGE